MVADNTSSSVGPGGNRQTNIRFGNRTIRLAVLAIAAAHAVSAATLVTGKSVDSCPNAKFTTVAAAVAAAAAGDTIEICPGVYAEQLVITKPLTLLGLEFNGMNRVVLRPALAAIGGLPFQAVITVMNTKDVIIQHLTIDASNNSLSGCGTPLAGVHFFNASGTVDGSAITGAQLQEPQSCLTLFGNAFGIHVDSDSANPGPFRVFVTRNSIHEFGRSGVMARGAGVTVEIDGNHISGAGPSLGVFQFAIFLANGVVGVVTRNLMSQGLCGELSIEDCLSARSEGVVLRAVGGGTIVDGNIITNVQSGIFVNGGSNVGITNNTIRNIEGLSGINIQGTAAAGFTNSIIEGNTISNVGPIDMASKNREGCGINELPNSGVSGNVIRDNTILDAYCGVAHVSADFVGPGTYRSTLHTVFNSDLYLEVYPSSKLP